MPYGQTLNIATTNCSGLGITEWDTTISVMGTHSIGMLALQDTHISHNATLRNKSLYTFSSDHTPKPTPNKGRGKGKKGGGMTWETAGVGFCLDPHITNALKDIHQTSIRNCTIVLHSENKNNNLSLRPTER